MDADDREPPPLYFGDYPHGAYFSAVRHDVPEAPEEEDYSVDGPGLRIMWDEGAGPLWSGELLPDEPEWLRRALGLSDSLIADLLEWQNDKDTAASIRRSPPQLDERGELLAVRLQSEVGSRFEVSYQG